MFLHCLGLEVGPFLFKCPPRGVVLGLLRDNHRCVELIFKCTFFSSGSDYEHCYFLGFCKFWVFLFPVPVGTGVNFPGRVEVGEYEGVVVSGCPFDEVSG